MAWPSWMPLAARPSHWIDWSSIFRDVIPREWPKRLYAQGSQAYADLIAFGEALALARDMTSLLQHNIWPALDTDYLFTDRWEESFGLQPSGTNSQRVDRLIAHMRQRGTMTQDLVKAIMCRAWGSNDPGIVQLTSPDPADVATAAPDSEKAWAFNQTNMHISQVGAPGSIDQGLAEDMIAKAKPTWETWTVGQLRILNWGVHAIDGEWNQRVWK